MTISMPRPPHRLERLRTGWRTRQVDCTVVLGADNVNHLCGYWRYFGGPSALVDRPRRRADARRDAWTRRRSRSALSDADQVLGYGERGFGIDLDPVASLVATVAAVPAVAQARRIGVGSELPGADGRLGAAVVAGTVVDAGRGAPPDQADQGLGRAREDQRRLRALLARASRPSRTAPCPA